MSDNKETPILKFYADDYVIIPFENVDAVDGDLLAAAPTHSTLVIDIHLKNSKKSIRLTSDCGSRAFMDQYKAYLRQQEIKAIGKPLGRN